MTITSLFSASILFTVLTALSGAEPLRICATVTDLGSLVQSVGGDAVTVTVFARGSDDPHFIEPRPSFISALAKADALVEVGMELEIGWLPPIVQQAGNPRLLPGKVGRIVASTAITPLGVPTGPVDRSQGDVHAAGNPHFLTDPICGMLVARLIRDQLSRLRPDSATLFAANYANLESDVVRRLIGAEAADGLDPTLVVDHAKAGTLMEFLAEHDRSAGGWLGALAVSPPDLPHAVVCDHDQWPYFARRFGLRMVGFLEPLPGLPPTSRHLAELAENMRVHGVRVILLSPYFDPRPAQKVAKATGASIVTVANQVGSLPNTGDYVSAIAYNVSAVAAAYPAQEAPASP